MKRKLEAVFIGGDRDGKTILVDHPHKALSSVVQHMLKTGEFVEVCRFDYKLVSNGPPLRYQAEF
ncbi:MAG: hypothetical protein ABIR24_04690 [Verrucomicrobiota bacterium]